MQSGSSWKNILTYSTGQVDIGEYTVLLSSTTLVASILLSFFKMVGEIDNRCKSMGFYREYLDTVEKNSGIYKSNSLPEPELDFSNEKICFENVSFIYPNTSQYVLRNINIEITHGEKIGIVGLNGSGKTTLIKLLCRIYDPTEGRITLNGVDIRQIPYHTYCKHIGIVLQDFALFAYSVRENILFDQAAEGENGILKEKLRSSIEKSGLSEKIAKLPKGLEASVCKKLDNEGVEFSGGEGQKLAMARALYKDSSIVILDEPTASLDPKAENEIYENFFHMAKGRTAIFISHRLAASTKADHIAVFAKGKITKYGTHGQLMESDGLYADMFRKQGEVYMGAAAGGLL